MSEGIGNITKLIAPVIILAVLLIPFFSIAQANTSIHSDSVKVAQQERSQSKADSLMIVKKEQKAKGLFARLFGIGKKKTVHDTTGKKQSDSTASIKKHIPTLVSLPKGGVSFTSLYTEGVNLNTGITGLYNVANIYQDINVLGIPLIAQATGVTDNGVFMKQFSSYSINFDRNTFASSLMKSAEEAEMNRIASERSHLPKGQRMNISDSMKSFDSIQAKLASPAYQNEIAACEKRFKKIEDSLAAKEEKNVASDIKKDTAGMDKKMKDSLKKDDHSLSAGMDSAKGGKKDSTVSIKKDTTELHTLRQKMAAYEKLQKRYEQLFEIKKNYSNLTKADSAAKSQESGYEKDKTAANNPNSAVHTLEQDKMLSPYVKFFSGFQYFNIGRSDPEISEFTLHNFMMNGVDVGYKMDNVYVSGGYGKEQAVINPYLIAGVTVPEYERTVEFGSIGIGSPKESNLYVTVLDISNPASASSLAESNWVFDLSKKIVMGKDLDVTGEVAHSYYTYTPNKLDSAAIPTVASNSSDMAYSLKMHYIIPGVKTDIVAQYLYTGNNYITLGNQFLINGTTNYRLQFKQKLSKKLSFDIGGAHVVQNAGNITGSQGTDNWLEAGVKFDPTRSVDLGFTYSPRQFQQQQGTVVANNITSNINQMSFTGNFKADIFDRTTVTSIFVGNFQSTTPESSAFVTQNINQAYYMMNEMVMLTNKSSLNFMGNEGRSSWTGDLTEFIGQGAYNMSIGKSFLFSSGLQWIQQPGIMSNGGGLIGSLSKTFGKWGKLALQLNCRNNLDDMFYFHTGQILISTNASIVW